MDPKSKGSNLFPKKETSEFDPFNRSENLKEPDEKIKGSITSEFKDGFEITPEMKKLREMDKKIESENVEKAI